MGVALLGDCAEQLGQKPEILERRIDETLLMVAQEEDVEGDALLKNRLLKSAREELTLFAPVQADVLLFEKFGELEGNREEGCTLTG